MPAREFIPVGVAVLTISDTRTLADDRSGQVAVDLLVEAGHRVVHRAIVTDDVPVIRAQLAAWIADD